MLRLSDFIICRKRYYNQSGSDLYLSIGTLQKRKFRTFLHLTLISKFLSPLSDFVVISTNLYGVNI